MGATPNKAIVRTEIEEKEIEEKKHGSDSRHHQRRRRWFAASRTMFLKWAIWRGDRDAAVNSRSY
jgi:hypothetical protein